MQIFRTVQQGSYTDSMETGLPTVLWSVACLVALCLIALATQTVARVKR